MRVVENVVELIGRTPMIRLGALKEADEADVFAKLEYLNPGMSVKDRTAVGLIRAAEASGALKPGGTILEATAGNTGVGLALVGVSRGYRVVIVMVEGYAREKMILIRGLGGEVVLVPHEAGIQGAVAKVAELVASTPGAVPMRQFESPANALVHYETTGPEIWEQLEGRVDGIALGIGTGGTFSGVARFLKEKDPAVACWGVEPPDSIYGGTGGHGEHMVEGIGNKWFPATFDRSLADGVFTIPHSESFAMVDRLGTMGLPAASSSGANVCGARRLARMLGEGKRVATLLCDPSERYFSKYVYDGLYEGRRIP
ncbi:MAG: cysteine synthase family protein [Holophagales bacterium]|jgi:cysteine synthase|nr:cysteine synthase family protein [Holophagales bacterium]